MNGWILPVRAFGFIGHFILTKHIHLKKTQVIIEKNEQKSSTSSCLSVVEEWKRKVTLENVITFKIEKCVRKEKNKTHAYSQWRIKYFVFWFFPSSIGKQMFCYLI